MTEPQSSSGRAGRGWSIVGIVCGALTVLQLIPIVTMVFGPLGILFGMVGYHKGDRSLGRLAIVVGVILIFLVALTPPQAT